MRKSPQLQLRLLLIILCSKPLTLLADHISQDEARHLLLWPERQQFLSHWQEAKQAHTEGLVPGLLDAHSTPTPDGRILKLPSEINTLFTSDQINRLWLNQAISFYRDHDPENALHALSQLAAPIHPLVEQRAWVLQGMIAQSQHHHSQALEWYDRVPLDSPLQPLITYNRALSLEALEQSDAAKLLLGSLASLSVPSTTPPNTDNKQPAQPPARIANYAGLLEARIQTAQGAATDQLTLLQQSHPLLSTDAELQRQLLMTEASLYRQQGDRRKALVALLELVESQDDAALSLHQSWLLQYLFEEGASSQAAELSAKWIAALVKQLEFQQQASSHITDPDFEKQLSRRHSGDNGSALVHFSQPTRDLIQELERVNTLIGLTEATLGYAKEYQALFKRGRAYLVSRILLNADLAPQLPLPVPPEYNKGNPEQLALEVELSRLVGVPPKWEERYTLLNGMALWLTTSPFPYPWWKGNVDLAAARKELAKYSSDRYALVEKLNVAVTPERAAKLKELEPRALQMLKALKSNRLELAKALADSLKQEPARMVRKTEQALLWLASKSIPQLQHFSATNQQSQLSLARINGQRRLKITPREPMLPNLSALHHALRLLQEQGQNADVAFKAQRHLADLTLMLAESAEIEARSSGDPNISFARAIELLRPLVDKPTSPYEHQQILYQLARAYDLNGDLHNSLAMLLSLQQQHPDSTYRVETNFRIAELQFRLNDFDLAVGQYQRLLDDPSAEEYRDRAFYKLAWSEFKLGNHAKAIEHFFPLVDKYWDERQGDNDSNRRLLADVLRVVAMTFAYQQGVETVQAYFNKVGSRPYEERVYADLGQYYERKRRYSDAAATYEALVQRYPDSDNAPYYQSRIVAAFSDGGFPIQAWPARETFVSRFGPQSGYWLAASETRRNYVREYLPDYLLALAKRDHAAAQLAAKEAKENKLADQDNKAAFNYGLAIAWYDQFIDAMPTNQQLPEIYFLKAEALTDLGQIEAAAQAYELAAYAPGEFDRRPEAGYAALLTYQQLYQRAQDATVKQQWLQTSIAQSRRFVSTYPNAPQAPQIATKLAEDYLLSNDNAAALEVASVLLEKNGNLAVELRLRLWRVRAHASFTLAQYATAEHAYLQALQLELKADERQVFRTRTAEAIYKQGEQARDQAKDNRAAIDHFLRLGKVISDAAVRPNAEFDAATLLLAEQRWSESIDVLEQFRQQYPKNPLQETIPDKLVVAYENTQQWSKASFYLNQIYQRERESALGREALWRAAQLQQKAGNDRAAGKIYAEFVTSFPQPLEEAMDAREILVQIADKAQQPQTAERWLDAMIEAVQKAETVSERSLLLASKAALRLGRARTEAFEKVQLTLPLEKSLSKKQKLMEQAAGYLNQTINFGLAEPSTFATTMLGDIYRNLSQALMQSARPKELDELALEQYEILLEEQALPFEDQAIEFYELNLKWISEGIYTPGIATSLERLRTVMPARYDKPEQVPSYVEAIE